MGAATREFLVLLTRSRNASSGEWLRVCHYRLYKLYESGAVVWTWVIVDETIESAPALANDVLFLIAGGKLIALSAATGYILYSHANADGAPFVGTPAIANGMVYVHAADAKGEYIYAFGPPVRAGA